MEAKLSVQLPLMSPLDRGICGTQSADTEIIDFHDYLQVHKTRAEINALRTRASCFTVNWHSRSCSISMVTSTSESSGSISERPRRDDVACIEATRTWNGTAKFSGNTPLRVLIVAFISMRPVISTRRAMRDFGLRPTRSSVLRQKID